MNRIKDCRLEAGLSQVALAQKMGVSPQAVQKWESGVSDPKWAFAGPLAAALDCTIDDLFEPDPAESAAS